ncbi:STAS domain-containing protein [Streptomyces sp. ODS28]|uniref:STAS domain-containing protein n=1 Tax=Streptomyces sp. ODS28 TaxID=3136688 RepID=UPI0031F03C4B
MRWTSRPAGLRLEGSINASTRPSLERDLWQLPDHYPRRRVHLDLRSVTRIDLAGAALLVTAAARVRRSGGEVRLHLGPELEAAADSTLVALSALTP